MITLSHLTLPFPATAIPVCSRLFQHFSRKMLVLTPALLALAPAAAGAAEPAHGTWTVTASLSQARWGQTATRLPGGDVLVAGGNHTGNIGGILASAVLYHPATGTWTSTGSMHAARAFFTATLLPDGRVLAAGGCAGCPTKRLASAELYNPATGTWTKTASMPTARDGHSATLLPDGQVLVVGGCTVDRCASVSSSADLYNPRTGAWKATGSLHVARWGETVTRLPGGDVLVAGGNHTNNPGTILASAERYHPGTAVWTITGSMHVARGFATAALLSTGQVLVAGGCGICQDDVLASAELYNPATGTWTVTGSMHSPRDDQAMVSLPGSKVLVVGGWDGNGFVGSAEIYHPSTGSWATAGTLHTPAAALTATRLRSGQILTLGGHSDQVLADAELYHP